MLTLPSNITKVRRNNNRQIMGEKRQYLPYTIAWTCANCARGHQTDMTEDPHYLSFPVFGEWQPYTLWCSDCDHTQTIEVNAKLALSIRAREGA